MSVSGPLELGALSPTDPAPLTPRQFDVMRRLALGHKWSVICSDLGITRRTLAAHRKAVLVRCGVSTFVEALSVIGWLNVPEGEA